MSKLRLPSLLADIVEIRRMCVFSGFMVPVVINGLPYGADVDTVPAPKPGLGVEDFVLGYLALGPHHITDSEFGTALCVNYDPLPSRWRDRAIALHRAFGPDLGPVRDYFRSTGIGVMLSKLDDAEDITRFGTPRRALMVYALAAALRADGSHREPLADAVRRSEPTATNTEIREAAHAALAWAAEGSVEPEPVARLDAGYGGRQEAYL